MTPLLYLQPINKKRILQLFQELNFSSSQKQRKIFIHGFEDYWNNFHNVEGINMIHLQLMVCWHPQILGVDLRKVSDKLSASIQVLP